MNRDMELIRKILLSLEGRPYLKAEGVAPIEGYGEAVIAYHELLLAQAGLVDYEPELTATGRIVRAHVIGLNWAGHEFLDSVRTDSVWRKLLQYARERGGGLPFELLKELAAELLKKSLPNG